MYLPTYYSERVVPIDNKTQGVIFVTTETNNTILKLKRGNGSETKFEPTSFSLT